MRGHPFDLPGFEPGTVWLVGEGGVGKTRLAGALCDAARKRQWSVALGRAYPVASGVPYATLLDRLIALSLERHAAKQQLKTSFL